MRLLIVGTMDGHVSQAGRIAHQRGAKVGYVDSAAKALDALRNGQGADLALMDVRLDIGDFIDHLKNERIALPVVGYGIGTDADAAVAAIKAGALEYLPLPPDAEMIAAILKAVSDDERPLIGQDPRMRETLALAERVAPSDAAILITGESGTGKEVIARFIHERSKRSARPFVAVNCAAIPENLLESELFGHEKGAFTGAVARRIGKFEEASGGTLLLDEISEMDARLQAKLLRAIQERVIDRVGGNAPVKVDIRVLATSNRDMEAEVKAGRFRGDLFFRLNVMNLRLPALRERKSDIKPLATHFIDFYTKANSLPPKTLSAAGLAKLESHSWPGNVRELENALHRAVLLAPADTIDVDSLQLTGESMSPNRSAAGMGSGTIESGTNTAPAGLVGRTVAEVERDLILETLKHCLGNRTHAATILGISIRTLRNKLREYTAAGLDVPLPGGEDARAVG